MSSPLDTTADVVQNLTSGINDFLKKRKESFVIEVFCRYAKQISELIYRGDKIIFPAGLHCALKDINKYHLQNVERNVEGGTEAKLEDAASIVAGLNSQNGGLDFEEFVRAIAKYHEKFALIAPPEMTTSSLNEIFGMYAKDTSKLTRSDPQEAIFEDPAEGKLLTQGKLIFPGELMNALGEFGVQIDPVKAFQLVASMDLDENGGLDLDEFRRAVPQPPTPLEQWVDTLPLSGMLAQCLAALVGAGSDLLRGVSGIDAAGLDAIVRAFSGSLRRVLEDSQAQLKNTFEQMDAKAGEAGDGAASKFTTFKMSTGGVTDYFAGLAGRIGSPNPNLSEGMEKEHCAKVGSQVEFTTSNYGVTTTPEKEYKISTGQLDCPAADMLDKKGRRVRVIRRIEELKQLVLSRRARLTVDEILAVVLYTGPMFQVYNTVLRRFPAKEYEVFMAGGNLFSTTIFVLVSAVIKIARVMRLPPGLELFRGLGGLTQLPESFLRDDEHGCRGYMEWGFLSTTACRETAIEYSGVGEGKPLPMVIQTRASSIDRGACIKEFSQYPGEVEYLWPPCSFLEPSGPSYVVEGSGSFLTMLPVGINANGKALTVEELVTQKKDLHISVFKHAADDLLRELHKMAEERGAQERLDRDWARVRQDGTAHTVEGLLKKLNDGVLTVLQAHERTPPKDYLQEGTYRRMVVEMLDARTHALAALRFYIEDPTYDVAAMMLYSNEDLYRDYLSFLRRTLPATGEERVRCAEHLCRVAGLVESRADEVDRAGRTRLMAAAAVGASAETVELLVTAGGDINGAVEGEFPQEPRAGWTALMYAAASGNVSVVEALCRLKANVNGPFEKVRPPLFHAAMYGQADVVATLVRYGAGVDFTDKAGSSPLFKAAQYGHVSTVEALCHSGARLDLRDECGATALYRAAENGQAAVVKVLCGLGAAVDPVGCDGVPSSFIPLLAAARGGHAAVVQMLCEAGASLVATDSVGSTALQVAMENKHMEVEVLLRGRGAT